MINAINFFPEGFWQAALGMIILIGLFAAWGGYCFNSLHRVNSIMPGIAWTTLVLVVVYSVSKAGGKWAVVLLTLCVFSIITFALGAGLYRQRSSKLKTNF